MNALLLIDSIVRQVTVLIAQLATSGGIRAPVAHLANQVFVDLANELELQGVSRKVSADMFGMGLRSYLRKMRRLSEAQSEQGSTLWQAVLDFIRTEEMVTRGRVLERFELDGEIEISAVLHDLAESGIVFVSGSGRTAVFRAATNEELGRLAQITSGVGAEELAWVLVYRNGPIDEQELARLMRQDEAGVCELVQRLIESGRVQRAADARLTAKDFVISLGSGDGWEAAVFDHFQAVVQTVCQRLSGTSFDSSEKDTVGGSTYSFDIWAGHPMEPEVKAQLAEFRQRAAALRRRVEEHNRSQGMPGDVRQVIHYAGQCVIDREQMEEGDKGDGEV